jgi:ketosteroid isomerase-like protein
MSHESTIETLYQALGERDGATMASLYHPDARFSDPAFGDLRGIEVGMMWRMLCARAKDLRVEHSRIVIDGDRGTAHWEAWYTFSPTGRKVHNVIDALFRFEGETIIEHLDVFSLWRWSRQALGPVGLVLGWSPLVRAKVQAQARQGLDVFMKQQPSS